MRRINAAAAFRRRHRTEVTERPLSRQDELNRTIPGTVIYTGEAAIRGYALNRLCFSLNSAENRDALRADAAGYCARYGLSEAETALVLAKDVLGLVKAGANIYYLAKLAGTFGLNVQDIGAQQTGVSLAEFNRKLIEQAT